MIKILQADRDAYITNKIVDSLRVVSSNVGDASTLNLFKLYGVNTSGSSHDPLTENSRLLVHFNLDPIRAAVASGTISTSHSSFNCQLRLFDVYGGQPTPRNFRISVHPLSMSFDEGQGKDVVFHADWDVCNWLSGSRASGSWNSSGCSSGGAASSSVDYVTTFFNGASHQSAEKTQYFTTGEEDLQIDVTTIVSATLAGILPDSGFRVAFTGSLEEDTRTYWVKRFGSRTCFNETKRPQLMVRFNDSVHDDTTNLALDTSGTLFMYSQFGGTRRNITSASNQITGTNCLILRLTAPGSGTTYNLYFTGSQVTQAGNNVVGIYSASVYVPSTAAQVKLMLATSGSVTMTPVWESYDGTVAYLTGSKLTFQSTKNSTTNFSTKEFVVSVTNVPSEILDDQVNVVRVNIFDHASPLIKLTKIPIELPGLVLDNVHFSVRDVASNERIIDIDDVYKSTQVSSDGSGMWFKLDASNLFVGRSYVIDIIIRTSDGDLIYKNACQPFKIIKRSY